MNIRRSATLVALVLAALASTTIPANAQLASSVRIVKIHYKQSGTNMNTEYIVLKNTSTRRATITGWRVISSPATDNQAYTFPVTTIAPGGTLTLYTGRGRNTATTRHWGSTTPVWNNDGDVAVLRTKAGTTVDSCRYAGGGTTAYC